MEELANVLGRERVQLQFLLFKILALQHLLRTGDTRFLRWAGEEVRRAGQRLRETEQARVRLVDQLAETAAMPAGELTLAALSGGADEPWRTIFADHSQGFLRLAGEVDAVILLTRALAEPGGYGVLEVLDELAAAPFAVRQASIGIRHSGGDTMVLP
jgi:hypothetical protein